VNHPISMINMFQKLQAIPHLPLCDHPKFCEGKPLIADMRLGDCPSTGPSVSSALSHWQGDTPSLLSRQSRIVDDCTCHPPGENYPTPFFLIEVPKDACWCVPLQGNCSRFPQGCKYAIFPKFSPDHPKGLNSRSRECSIFPPISSLQLRSDTMMALKDFPTTFATKENLRLKKLFMSTDSPLLNEHVSVRDSGIGRNVWSCKSEWLAASSQLLEPTKGFQSWLVQESRNFSNDFCFNKSTIL
jgi:hypothetical protein